MKLIYRSLLHTAVSHGFLDGARLLIEKGASITCDVFNLFFIFFHFVFVSLFYLID